MIYPFTINGQRVEMRKIRELSMLSFGIVICGFLQRNIWLRLLLIWCIINWWINLFVNASYMPLANILSAMVIYIGIKKLLKDKIISVDGILKTICVSVIFQFTWMIMQKLNFDPIFYLKPFSY